MVSPSARELTKRELEVMHVFWAVFLTLAMTNSGFPSRLSRGADPRKTQCQARTAH